jgi:hypothetical protein
MKRKKKNGETIRVAELRQELKQLEGSHKKEPLRR